MRASIPEAKTSLPASKRSDRSARGSASRAICCFTRASDAATPFGSGDPRVRDGEFTMRTEKTGMVAIAPILPTLAASILAMPTGELTFIATERSTVN